jgi:hypothetical protein
LGVIYKDKTFPDESYLLVTISVALLYRLPNCLVKSRKASSEVRTVATRAAAISSNLEYKDDIYNQLFSKKREKTYDFNNYLMLYTLDPDWLVRQRKRWVLSLPTGQEIRHFLAI